MQLERLNTPSGRFYYPKDRLADGKPIFLMPSVTTVLKGLKSSRINDLLEKIGPEQFAIVSKNGADRGSVMHNYLENYFICLKATGDYEKSLYYTQKKTLQQLKESEYSEKAINIGRDLFYNYYYEGYLHRIKKVLFTEKFVWSLQYKYAGTLDFCFIDHNDKVVITDFKSASGTRDSETIYKYALQGAAYSIAFDELYPTPVDQIEIWVSSGNKIEEYSLSGAELVEKRNEYIHWVEKFHSNFNPDEIISKYYNTA